MMDIAALCLDNMPFLTGEQAKKLALYYDMLTDWNTRMNLTAITEPCEVVKKHFADSLLPRDLIPRGARVIDVGAGAGFPSLPLAIVREDISVSMLDSLNKRVEFLKAVTKELGVSAECLHARAEDAGQDARLRAGFDAALSRAVAAAPVLMEYTAPLIKVGGVSLMYKGAQAKEELLSARGAIAALHLEAETVYYPAEWGERYVIVARKLKDTDKRYPRKPALIKKQPL